MNPESAIANWQNWQIKPSCKPEIIGTLGGGLSNQSYLLEARNCRYVLRINATGHALPGIDRQREATIWRAASQAGIAPLLLHADQQFLVSDFIEGHGVLAKSSPSEEELSQVIGLLEKCHTLEVDVAHLDYESHVQHYWDLIEINNAQVDVSLSLQRQAMQTTLHNLLSSQTESALCHHDPVKGNFVGSAQQLFLIDWEYAAKGMAVMDYAALATEWGLEDQFIIDRTRIQSKELKLAKTLYRYLCQLWTATQN